MASKKKLGLVAVAGAAALLASAAVPAASQAASQKTIAFVMGAINDPFFNAMKVGAEAEAKAKGVKLIWQGDVQYSPATQLPVVDQVLAQKPDGLVLIPTDPVALQPSVAKAKAAGITVVNVDTHVNDLTDVVSFITGDNADGGAKAADAIANAIRYKAGKKYQVVVGLTSATATTNVARLEGFTKAVAAKYPGIQIVDKAYSQSDSAIANTNVNNWFTAEVSINAIGDRLANQIKSDLDNSFLVGGPLTKNTSAAVLGTVQATLTNAVSNGLIQSYQNLALTTNPATPTTVNVTFQYAPTYPISYIQVTLSLNSQTGQITYGNAQSNFVVY